jgi:hypothetical protein
LGGVEIFASCWHGMSANNGLHSAQCSLIRTLDALQACHQGLAAKRLNGEWFEVGSHEAVEYVRRVADGFGVKGFG